MSRFVAARLLAATALVVSPLLVEAGPVHAAPVATKHAVRPTVPTKEQWLADVHTAMKGARAYVKHRAASGDAQLAINFDIDNTVLATYYGGGAIEEMLKFAGMAQRHGVAILFNTGRVATQHDSTVAQLTSNGYPVTDVCLRAKGETLPHGKQRCRDQFIDAGWTLIANVGNRPTDFAGDGYERAFKLPDYGGVLG